MYPSRGGRNFGTVTAFCHFPGTVLKDHLPMFNGGARTCLPPPLLHWSLRIVSPLSTYLKYVKILIPKASPVLCLLLAAPITNPDVCLTHLPPSTARHNHLMWCGPWPQRPHSSLGIQSIVTLWIYISVCVLHNKCIRDLPINNTLLSLPPLTVPERPCTWSRY